MKSKRGTDVSRGAVLEIVSPTALAMDRPRQKMLLKESKSTALYTT